MRAAHNELAPSSLQFGFKQRHSTVQCTYVLEEVCNKYVRAGSDIYVMLLDASKAFDRVHYTRLFGLLRQRSVCPMLCRFLAYSYTHQSVRTMWKSCQSEPFRVKNGVKQGAVLSPTLFNVYLDVLLKRLSEGGVGCYLGDLFIGALAYADDVTLLASSRSALEQMLNTAQTFSNEFQVQFNVAKCQLVTMQKFTAQHFDAKISFNGVTINSDPNATHLGNVIGLNAQTARIDHIKQQMINQTNMLSSLFSRTNLAVKYRLFKIYCMSLYGCQLWNLDSTCIETLLIAWRKCLRKLLCLHPRTHSRYLHQICDDEPFMVQVIRRSLKFMSDVINHHNPIVRVCAFHSIMGSSSAISSSISFISSFFNVPRLRVCNLIRSREYDKFIFTDDHDHVDDIANVVIIRELMDLVICFSLNYVPNFFHSELRILLDFVCIA